MAKNFEIVFPCDKPIIMADNSLKQWNYEEILSVVESHNCKYIIARHPADIKNDKKCCDFNHWHCGIHTNSDNVYATIAKWFGVSFNSVQAIKSRFESTYALYLAHYNAKYDDGTDKPNIPIEDIVNNFDLNYDKLIGNVQNNNARDEILEKIAKGEIRKYQFEDMLTDSFRIRWSTQIKNALAIWNDRKMRGKRKMAKDVIWIYGEAGVGKTELATFIAKSKYGEFGYFHSDSGANPFDNYGDQPCLILDDVGSDNLNSKVVLKLFDPYNKCFTKARYFNKAIDADLIIVTSSVSPEKFWQNCRTEYKVDGSWEQLLRRLTGGIYHFLSKKEMQFTMYDNNGKEPITVVVTVPEDVQNRSVTVSAEGRLNSALVKYGMKIVETDPKKFNIEGQMSIDDLKADNPF